MKTKEILELLTKEQREMLKVRPYQRIPPTFPVPAMVTCTCSFPDREVERKAREEFIREYGDKLPEEVIKASVSDEYWDNWQTICHCEDPQELIAVGHYEPVDWFLCAIKGIAVKTEHRGKGLGRSMVGKVADEASKNPQCLVLAADVTFDNTPSIRALKRSGFEPVGEFCWEKGEKPVEILHFVRYKPTEDMTCLVP